LVEGGDLILAQGPVGPGADGSQSGWQSPPTTWGIVFVGENWVRFAEKAFSIWDKSGTYKPKYYLQ
jgi:hypothetical protein